MKPSLALAEHRNELRRIVERYGVSRPRLFGSVVAGMDQDDSDLDLLVDPAPETTLLTIAGLQCAAEELLGVRVDVLTPGALPKRFRAQVLAEAVPL
jgi:predicted nucleotidyltransferase